METQVEITLLDVVDGIRKGLQARGSGPRCGCGRAYVVLSSREPRSRLELFKKACAQAGVRYLGKAYGTGNRAAYIGYDNADGTALAQAEAIEANLRCLGLDVYADGVSD